MTDQTFYTIQEASEMCGISTHMIRRLCNAGLIPRVRRNRRGFRIFTEPQINLAQTLAKMRESGFKTRELKKFSSLYRQGKSTKPERKRMLATRKRQLWQEIEARQAAIDFIERQEEYLERP